MCLKLNDRAEEAKELSTGTEKNTAKNNYYKNFVEEIEKR